MLLVRPLVATRGDSDAARKLSGILRPTRCSGAASKKIQEIKARRTAPQRAGAGRPPWRTATGCRHSPRETARIHWQRGGCGAAPRAPGGRRRRQPLVDPSSESIDVTQLLLTWYRLYHRSEPAKDEEDIRYSKELADWCLIHLIMSNFIRYICSLNTMVCLILN